MVTRAMARTAPLRSAREIAAAFEDLATFGYCLLERALSEDAVEALKRRIDEQAAGEAARGEAFIDSKVNQRIWMLPNKGRMFRDLVLDPLVEAMMGHLLGGPGFLLSSLTANIARPGGVPMNLHSDQGYVDFWTEKPLVANILFMLDAFTDENGATRVVPGSHLTSERRAYAQDETVAAEGPAGTVMVFDGRLAHGTGANRTAGARRAVLAYHCRPFVRQQENYFLGLDPQLRRTEREAFLRRLGFQIWAGLGRINHPTDAGVLAPVERPTGPLSASGEPDAIDAGLPASALWPVG